MADFFIIFEGLPPFGPFPDPHIASGAIEILKLTPFWHDLSQRNYQIASTEPLCDFCSGKNPAWMFKAPTAKDQIVTHGEGGMVDTDGQWAACNQCKQFIMAHEWEELSLHSAEEFAKSKGVIFNVEARQEILDACRKAHQFFREHWDGDEPDYVPPHTVKPH